ncbi:MAG: bifunctional phosphopantothenoylcysteine decarboxylase/phosphopantothenate--cysteine ligase CoaBC [Saprospirales bacterium]|nr:MAG: bifunctional phosphopantothenoylcysteine decarboxylase/phosphopantothenate--cysteine ligase CoaBC [Saprospirales bacterium]
MSSEAILAKNLIGKKIVLGICGSIAAYKSALLTRLLIRSGAEVRVCMTKSATTFVSPLTFSTLSKNKVLTDLAANQEWNDHVEWGLWADLILIAPATANSLSKMANGITDNFLTAVYLSARCPVIIAPAMDLDMWKHPSTLRNLKQLREDGVHTINVEKGELASGLSGEGRLAEPINILVYLDNFFYHSKKLLGQKVLITAGPTQEKFDPVRYISNHSSGKMGIALAEAFAEQGAEVMLVHGPVNIELPDHPSILLFPIKTAEEMMNKCAELHPTSNIAVFSAAVSDYRLKSTSEKKIKKTGPEGISLELIQNPDIAARLGRNKTPEQIHIGFALETDDEEANAIDKLKKKNFDLIVLNSLNDKGAGFGVDTNKVSLITQNNVQKLELKSKVEIAKDIVSFAFQHFIVKKNN